MALEVPHYCCLLVEPVVMVLNIHVRVFNCVDVNMSVIVPFLGIYCFGFFMKLRGWWQNSAQGDTDDCNHKNYSRLPTNSITTVTVFCILEKVRI